MIYRIDILNDGDADGLRSAWRDAVQEQSKCPGFERAMLHKVYKQINRTGYQFVSICEWQDASCHDISIRNSACRAHPGPAGTNDGCNQYTVINQGLSSSETSETTNIVVTNPYRIAPEDADKYADMWNTSKNHMEARDGFVSAYLYQCTSPEHDYYFVSRAEWRSEALFMRQFEGKDFRKIVEPFEDIFSICLSTVVDRVMPNR